MARGICQQYASNPPRSARIGHQRLDDMALGAAKRQRLIVGGEILRQRPWHKLRQLDLQACRVHKQLPGVHRPQIVVKQPPHRLFKVSWALLRSCLLGCVGSQQVVKGKPAGLVFHRKIGPGQFVQCLASVIHWDHSQTRGGWQADIRARVDTEQPEHAGGVLAQVMVRLGEHGAGGGRRVAGVEQVKTAAAELAGDGGQREDEDGPRHTPRRRLALAAGGPTIRLAPRRPEARPGPGRIRGGG